MSNLPRTLALLAALAMLPGMALAEAPGYNWIEAGYLLQDVDTNTSFDSADGWFGGLSFGGKSWHVFGEYQSTAFDEVGGIQPDLTNWFAGVGWHGLLGEKGDVVLEAAYVDTKQDFAFDDSGYRITGGVRYRLIKLLELNGFVNYQDLSDLGSDTGWEINAIVNLWRFGLGLGYEQLGDANLARAFLRFDFGPN